MIAPMTSHSDRRVGWVGACALLLIGGGVGALLDRTLERAPVGGDHMPAGPRSTTPTAIELSGLKELPGVLERLDETLRAFGTRVGERARTDMAPTTRRPIEASFQADRDDDDTLAAALRELSTALQTLPGNSGASSRPPRSASPRYVDRDSAFAFKQSLRQATLAEDGTLERTLERINAGHFLWTTQDVLNTYGTPDAISGSFPGSVDWTYQFIQTETEDEDISFYSS